MKAKSKNEIVLLVLKRMETLTGKCPGSYIPEAKLAEYCSLLEEVELGGNIKREVLRILENYHSKLEEDGIMAITAKNAINSLIKKLR